MKKKVMLLIIILGLISAFLTGCNAETVNETEDIPNQELSTGTNVPVGEEEVVSTEEVEPTEIQTAPTEEPEPIACTIAFESDRDGNTEIYRMDPDGSNVINLSNNAADDFRPVWSPDGSQIAFVSNRENDEEGGQFIYIMNADGSDLRQLTQENDSNWPDWSNDGEMITYTSQGDVFIIKADGSAPSQNLTNSPEEDEQPKWSPDNSKIAWVMNDGSGKNIFMMNTDGSDIVQITNDGTSEGAQWTNDGRIFCMWAWNDPDQFCQNCIIDPDTMEIEDAGGKGDLQKYFPFWTLDGDRVEVAAADAFTGDEEIFLIGEIYPDMLFNLTNNPAADTNPDWPVNCGPVNGYSTPNEPIEEEESQTSADSSIDIVIGIANPVNEMTEQRQADLVQACDELQIECVQNADMKQLTEQGVNAILVLSNKWHVMGAHFEIEETAATGIPVFILNAESDVQGVYNLSVETEAVNAGLKWMFKQMEGTGEFVYYNVGPNDSHQMLLDQALQEFPEINATSKPADFSGEKISEQIISELVTTNPDVKAIWANEFQNDVFWGIHNTEIENPPMLLVPAAEDMLRAWQEWRDLETGMQGFTAIKPGSTVYEGVYAAWYLLNGMEVNPEALIGNFGNTLEYEFPVITNDNLDSWLENIDTLRVGERGGLETPPMSPKEIMEKWFLE